MELLKEAYITIILEEETNSLVLDWIGAPTTDQFKHGKEFALQAIQEKNAKNIILNYQNLTAYLSLEIQVWTIHDWFDQVLTTSIKKIGVVTPSNLMAQIVIKSIFGGINEKTAGTEMELNYFDSPETASTWIGGETQQPEPVVPTSITPSPVVADQGAIVSSPMSSPTISHAPTESVGSFKGVALDDDKPEEAKEYIPPSVDVEDDPFAEF